MQFRKFDTTQYVIIACAVVHNIAIDAHDREPPIDPDLEMDIRQTTDGLRVVPSAEANTRRIGRNILRDKLIENYFSTFV